MAIGIMGMFLLIGTIAVSASSDTSVSPNDDTTYIPIWKTITVHVYGMYGSVSNAKVKVTQIQILRGTHQEIKYTGYNGCATFKVLANYFVLTLFSASAGNEMCVLVNPFGPIPNIVDLHLVPLTGSDSIPPALPDGVNSI